MADMENQNRNQNQNSGHTGKSDSEKKREGNATPSVNPDTGDTGTASTDYRDPHGNQSGREPEGGSGAGQSRGDESSFNPGNSTEPSRDQ